MRNAIRTSVIVPVLFLTGTVYGQSANEYRRTCREEAARRLNLDLRDVQARVEGSAGRNDTRVTWTAGSRRSGYCVINRRMSVVDFRGDEGGRPGIGRPPIGGDRPITNFPRVSVDTSGRGNYSGDGRSVRITRGWVDTRSGAAVALSGEGNFKVTFRGDVIRSNSDREFTLRIRDSDAGRANGTADVRLNSDRNEVESINVNGQMNGRPFNGSFNRN